MAQTKAQKAEQDAAIERLRGMLKPGDTLHTVLRHVSASGMTRSIDVYKLTWDFERAQPDRQWLSRLVATATDTRFDEKREAVSVGGAGMDMGFHLVYSLSYRLYPDGFTCIGERCPSNDHSNGDRDYSPHHHNSGGYALRHEWL